jgi:hypothetical protein
VGGYVSAEMGDCIEKYLAIYKGSQKLISCLGRMYTRDIYCARPRLKEFNPIYI